MGESCHPCFYRERPGLKKWTEQTWLNYLEKRSNEKRFQYCSDSSGRIQYMRAIHGHSGRSKDEISLQDNVKIPYNCIQKSVSRWFFPLLQLCFSIRSDCRRERFKRRTTNRILHSSGSHERTTKRRTLRRERARRDTL